MVYWDDERPPLPAMAMMGVQHALLSLMLTLYVVIAAQGLGLDPVEAAFYTSTSLLLMGVCTALQGLKTPFSAGLLLVAIPSPVALGVYLAVTREYGLGATMGAMMLSGFCVAVLARFIPRLRPVFPPEVIGVVVLMLGLSLIGGGVVRSTGYSSTGTISLPVLGSAGITVIIIVMLSIWGSARLRTVAVLIGALAGTAVSVFAGAGHAGALDRLGELPVFALPLVGLYLPMPEFSIGALLPMLLIFMIAATGHFASVLAMDKMNDAHWRRADMPMVARAVSGIALVNILNGATGTLPTVPSTANIGLAHATGITARRVGVAAGIVLVVAAFLPQLAGLIVATPAPVIGGILIYTAAYMIVSGMDLLMSRMLNNRRVFTIGLSIVAGVSVMVVPQLTEEAPDWSNAIVQSGLVVATIMAVALNGLFRIGIWRKATVILQPDTGSKAATDFLEHQGRVWGARHDVVIRAGMAVGEALESLRRSGLPDSEPVQLAASFDEFSLVCELDYKGRALAGTSPAAPELERLLETEDDAAIEAAMKQVSGVLIARLADRLRATQTGERAGLRLFFEH